MSVLQGRNPVFHIVGSDGVIRQVVLAGNAEVLDFDPSSSDLMDALEEHREALRIQLHGPTVRRSSRIEMPLEKDEELEGLNRHDRRAILAQRRQKRWQGFSWKDK